MKDGNGEEIDIDEWKAGFSKSNWSEAGINSTGYRRQICRRVFFGEALTPLSDSDILASWMPTFWYPIPTASGGGMIFVDVIALRMTVYLSENHFFKVHGRAACPTATTASVVFGDPNVLAIQRRYLLNESQYFSTSVPITTILCIPKIVRKANENMLCLLLLLLPKSHSKRWGSNLDSCKHLNPVLVYQCNVFNRWYRLNWMMACSFSWHWVMRVQESKYILYQCIDFGSSSYCRLCWISQYREMTQPFRYSSPSLIGTTLYPFDSIRTKEQIVLGFDYSFNHLINPICTGYCDMMVNFSTGMKLCIRLLVHPSLSPGLLAPPVTCSSHLNTCFLHFRKDSAAKSLSLASH